MGIDLFGRGEAEARFSHDGWRNCLNLALAFGWRPAGTVHRHEYMGPPNGWPGDYVTNDFQLVTDDDAKALATALRRALRARRTKRRLTKKQQGAWSATRMNVICGLAKFCEAGSFSIC